MDQCDVSHDNACNVIDALFIMQCDVGIPNSFCPGSGPVQVPSSTGTIENVATITVGDGVPAGEMLTVPVTASFAEELGSMGGTIDIRYDPAVACTVLEPFAGACNPAFEQDGIAPDVVRLSLVTVGQAGLEAPLAQLTFAAAGGGTSALEPVVVLLSNGLEVIPAAGSHQAQH